MSLDIRSAHPKQWIKGAKADWEIIIGMEIHAQVNSNAKLFSGASTTFGNDPNANVSLVDAAMPGMLPVINKECVRRPCGRARLKAEINKTSRFDRKNYFYPDLPQGYQISQFAHPIVGEGEVIVDVPARPNPSWCASSGCISNRMREVDPRSGPAEFFRGSQPRGRRADGDRLEAGSALGGRGAGLCHEAPHHPALSRHLRWRHGEGQSAC